MHRKYMRRGMMVTLMIIAGIFLLSPGLTFAGVGGSDVPTVTPDVTVGKTGYSWSFTITNTSTDPDDGDNVKVITSNDNILFTTTCGVASPDSNGECPVGQREAPNTITISPLTATGQAGTACATSTFTVAPSSNGNPNEYAFTSGSTVILGPSSIGGNPARCKVNFAVNVNAGVVNDSSTDAGLQTSQIAYVKVLQDVRTNEKGFAAGSSTVTVHLCNPTITTAPIPTSSSLPPTPVVLNDSATLAGGCNPTGTILFQLFRPTDQNCTSAAICTIAVPVTGNAVYNTISSGGCSVTQPGVYHWVATYSGDISNNPAKSNCADETVPVLGIVTAQNPTSACAGADLNDSATLSGGNTPKGNMTFTLYGNNNCGGAVCGPLSVPVTNNGTFSTPSPCHVTAVGTYYWQACYVSTDGINPTVCSGCGDEPVVIKKIPVQIVTAAKPTSGCVGATLNDSATLSGGCSPTGTITFKLFGVNDQNCNTAILTTTVSVNGIGTYNTNTGFVTTAPGTYQWTACYSGDSNNDGVCTKCGDSGEAATITQCQQCTGECPYIGVVGNDCVNNTGSDPVVIQSCVANPFYFSEKHRQFLYDQEAMGVLVCSGTNPPASPQTRVPVPPAPSAGCEQFRSNKPINQPEICDTGGVVHNVMKGDFHFVGEPNAVITKQSAGYFEWWIRLPLKPDGEINICIQCGILKPNTFSPFGFGAVELCAAETGERIGRGLCTRNQVAAGINPIVNSALPKITAWAYPGPFAPTDEHGNTWKPFRLTAYKNPGTYSFWDVDTGVPDANAPITGPIKNSLALQVLDGSLNARVLLKSCMDKCVIAKIPVTGQANALGDTENDLEAGDLIKVRLDIPNTNTVDIYCHSQSAKIMGIGVPD